MTEYEVKELIRKDRDEHSAGCFGIILILAVQWLCVMAISFTGWRFYRIEKAMGFSEIDSSIREWWNEKPPEKKK